MKKSLYILPFILIFVLLFSSVVCAAGSSNSGAIDTSRVISPIVMTDAEKVNFDKAMNWYITLFRPEEYVYLIARTEERSKGYNGVTIYASNKPFYITNCSLDVSTNTFIYSFSSDGTVFECWGRDNDCNSGFSYNNFFRELHPEGLDSYCYSSHDVYGSFEGEAYLYLRAFGSDVEEEPEDTENDFNFSIFDHFQDFTNTSTDIYENAQNQTVTDNPTTPNDSIFQNLLQSVTGLLHTGNQITQQISSQIQNFTEQFFNNFAQSALGLLSDIKTEIAELALDVLPDNLVSMVDDLYNSGLDSNGNFSLGNMANYWFVPSDDFLSSQYNEFVSGVPCVGAIISLSNDIRDNFINIDAHAPVFTIPSGTYSFINFEEPIVITFEWFEGVRSYTDIFIAAFLYFAFAMYIIKQLPSVIHGFSSVSSGGADK